MYVVSLILEAFWQRLKKIIYIVKEIVQNALKNMCGRKVFLQLQMSHTLVPMTKVNVRGSSKAPNDAVWMSFPYSLVSSYSLTPFPFDFSLKQPQRVLIPGDNLESRGRREALARAQEVLHAQVRCPHPSHTQRCFPGRPDTQTPPESTRDPGSSSPPSHPSSIRSGTCHQESSWHRHSILWTFTFWIVFLRLWQGWVSKSSGRQKLAWQAKVSL